ncbi:hypothetical protein Q0812_01815 [Brevundimonas sp. 2R-24]|uniref:Uncharacterized protein n=1 Tax=Peiella sedimenti TaxID=3061083 RepID=A0ABT8SIF8_9CAUL|nr:hypothetical protein [Caulobacteraceae bacterium XZ-24]
MLRGILLGAALAVGVAAPAAAGDLAGYVRHALEQMEYQWNNRTYSRQYFLEQGNLQQGGSWTYSFNTAADEVIFIAGCDQDCSGLSMTAFDRASGRLIDQRRGSGKSMEMRVRPGTGRHVIVSLTMERCSTQVCYYAISAVH